MEYASNGKGNLGVTLGAIGTGLSLFNGHNGFGILGNSGYGYVPEGKQLVTKDELDYVQTIGRKDAEIALLKSEQNTEVKIADVYERLITRINADQREQTAWNTQQMVNNAQMSSAIATNANSIAALQNTCSALTKTVIPIDNVCPQPMQRYNSWTAPTTVTSPNA